MLIVENLTKSFGKNVILKDINFTLEQGQILTLIGPSGSGKSTLLRCLGRLEDFEKGDVKLGGVSLSKANLKTKLKIGMVFQNFNLFNHYNVIENIIFAPIYHKLMNREDAIKKARELLGVLNLSDKENFYPADLSGGQKQRIAIARCLILEPEIILFDEPTSALDPESVNDVCDLIKLVAAKNVACLVVTHELRLIRKIASNSIFLENGEIIVNQTADNFINSDHSRLRQYLDLLN